MSGKNKTPDVLSEVMHVGPHEGMPCPVDVKGVSKHELALAKQYGRRIPCYSPDGLLDAYEYQGRVYVLNYTRPSVRVSLT